ncbi:protein unc-13 homolog isoform X2 [Magnolia sinica]|uniref:protein unc-13 homolog isoform X2 n=1 Tax=Magnolia sinica TaxID=86752 RepID=UPI002659E4AD|nr:protein unc-13 homolog isoform X2 [Magnolia sinica]
MGHNSRRESLASTTSSSSTWQADPIPADPGIEWPFGKVEFLDREDLRETAYEVFFAACRSSPGFGGRGALSYYPAQDSGEGAGRNGSRMKMAMGLKTTKRGSPRRSLTCPSSTNGVATAVSPRAKRAMTPSELMRRQMRMSEQSESRLRKTLMRMIVGQMSRRAETIILPLELLRHLKPSEFEGTHEYSHWQRRQLKIMEAGILLHPLIPLDPSNASAVRLHQIIQSSKSKIIDTSKNSETMKTLCNCVMTLAWRGPNGTVPETCHWADGYPINLHLYIAILQSVFDIKDATMVIDEIDDLVELMKKTWSTLGITRLIHNVCFSWVLFHQFVATGLVEHDLLFASLTILAEVANDAKRADKDILYGRILSSALASMQGWAEKRLLDYHGSFQKNAAKLVENILPLALSATKILDESVSSNGAAQRVASQIPDHAVPDSTRNRVDYYIRSSLRKAFAKILEGGNANSRAVQVGEDTSKALLALAKETEELALREKENFSPILRRWHPVAAGVAAVTLHECYGAVLKHYLGEVSTASYEVIQVLQMAGKLEKVLVQMVVEDSVDCEDGGKTIVREMVLYEVDSVIMGLMRAGINQRLKIGEECLHIAKETETWNPMSRKEPYAESAVEIMKMANGIADSFFEMPVQGPSRRLIKDIADGLQTLLRDYISFSASCASKQSYIPALPPLTRCNQDSKIVQLWRKASQWWVGTASSSDSNKNGLSSNHQPRPLMSRGTQRLYIRLNTLHYLFSEVDSLYKSLSPSSTPSPLTARFPISRCSLSTTPSFDLIQSSIQSATQHVSKVAAFRLIFHDLHTVFYENLYTGSITNTRIQPTLHLLKQNLTLLTTILTNQARPLAVIEVMKASFEAFLTVLLAGGRSRTFTRSDYEIVAEDFRSLKLAFCTCGEGSMAEEVVEKEAEVAEGVVELMGLGSEQLVEDFSIIACEMSGLGIGEGSKRKVPMPPTTGRWNQADPNTILRVLCHRNDSVANSFLKKTFQLPRRK